MATSLRQCSSQVSGSHQICLDQKTAWQVHSIVKAKLISFFFLCRRDSAQGICSSGKNSKSPVLLLCVERTAWVPETKTSRKVAGRGLVWRSRIRASYYNCKWPTRRNNIGLFIYSQSALRVSCDVFTHHQEHVTVFTALVMSTDVAGWCHGWDGTQFNSVPVHPWHWAATSVDITRSGKYSHVLLMMVADIARNT